MNHVWGNKPAFGYHMKTLRSLMLRMNSLEKSKQKNRACQLHRGKELDCATGTWVQAQPNENVAALDDASWSVIKESYKWQNKKHATFGTTYRMQTVTYSCRRKESPCASDRQKVGHHINLGEYGVDGHWVILQRLS